MSIPGILKKGIDAILVLWGVATLIFLLFNVLSGDPARMMLDQREDPELLAAIRTKYGLDQPLMVQYGYYLNDISPISWHSNIDGHYTKESGQYNTLPLFSAFHGVVAMKWPYLRTSFQQQGRPVSDIIGQTLPNTIILAFAAIGVALLLGLFLGVISALNKDRWIDRMATILGTSGMALPSFFSAILFAWIFGYLLSDYTGLNMTGSLMELDDLGEGVQLRWENLILPAITLGIRPLGVVIQMTRNSVLETLNAEYIRTARAKGLSTSAILWRHVMKNSLNPVITAVSGWFASMLAGAVFVEFIFGWNGLGKQVVEALDRKDLPVVMGAVLVIAFMFVLINLFVDFIYTRLDPRIRTS